MPYIKKLIILIIKGIRPHLGPEGCCIFELTCTEFALIKLQDDNIGLIKAIFLITKRILLCNPICRLFS